MKAIYLLIAIGLFTIVSVHGQDIKEVKTTFEKISDVYLGRGQGLRFMVDTSHKVSFSALPPSVQGRFSVEGNILKYIPSVADFFPIPLKVYSDGDSVGITIFPYAKREEYLSLSRYKVGEILALSKYYSLRVDSGTNTKTLVISGKEIILDGSAGNPFTPFFYRRGDIRFPYDSVKIYAEKLLVSNKVLMPGASVIICAREIVFDAKKILPSIDITPLKNVIAVSSAVEKEGAKGKSGSDFTLRFEKISLINFRPGAMKKVFIANGGDGSDAPFGADGVPLPDIPYVDVSAGFTVGVYSSDCDSKPNVTIQGGFLDDPRAKNLIYVWYHYRRPGTNQRTHGGRERNDHDVACSSEMLGEVNRFREVFTDEIKQRANPRPGGKPGKGGMGGNVYANHDIRDFVSVVRGQDGNPDTSRFSGKVADPSKRLWAYIYDTYHPDNSPGFVEWNYPAQQKIYPIRNVAADAKNGSVFLTGGKQDWKDIRFASHSLSRADDLFRFGYVDSAFTVYEYYVQEFFAAGKHALSIEQDPGFESLKERTIMNYNKIKLNLDFYGNRNNWVPKMDFVMNYALYQRSLNTDFDIIARSTYLAKTLGDRNKTIDNLNRLLRTFEESNELFSSKINTITLTDIPAIESDMGRMSNYLQLVDNRLMETEITTMAEHNVDEIRKKANRKNFFRALTAIAKAVPVYQPALGIAATAIEVVALNSDTSSLIQKLGYVASNYQQMQADQQAINSALNNAITLSRNSTGTTDLATVKRNRGEIIRNVKATVDRFKEIIGRIDFQTVPDKSLQAEINRLKSENPLYKSLIDSIAKLTQYNKQLSDKILRAASEINMLSGIMIDNLTASVSVRTALSNASVVPPATIAAVWQVRKNAMQQISYYQYLFAKSYEYFTLKPYPGYGSTVPVMEQLVVRTDLSEMEEIHAAVKAIYQAQINDMFAGFIQQMNGSYQSLPAVYQQSIRIKAEDLSELNTTGRLAINFNRNIDYNLFKRSMNQYEDVLVKSVSLSPVFEDRDLTGSETLASSTVKIVHSGISARTVRSGKYLFYHLTDENSTPHEWSLTLSFIDGTNSKNEPDNSYLSLLCQYINRESDQFCTNKNSDVAYDSDFIILKSDNISSDKQVVLKELRITLTLSAKTATDPSSQTVFSVYPQKGSLQAPIYIRTGKGNFVQNGYYSSVFSIEDTVNVYALPWFEGRKFQYWQSSGGGNDPVNPITVTTARNNQFLIPVYK